MKDVVGKPEIKTSFCSNWQLVFRLILVPNRFIRDFPGKAGAQYMWGLSLCAINKYNERFIFC